MRLTGIFIFILLVLCCDQSCASELSDLHPQAIVEVDSVSLQYDGDLVLQFTYCHEGLYSTLGYSLRSGDLEMVKNIDFVRPVKADVPKQESARFGIPQEWMEYNKLPIIFSVYFTLYDKDAFESAGVVREYSYIDTFEVTIKE